MSSTAEKWRPETEPRQTARRPVDREKFWHCAEISWAVRVGRTADDVEDFRRGFLHVEHDAVDAADEIVVAGIGGDCHGEAAGHRDERAPDATGQPIRCGERARLLQLMKHAH